MARANSFRKELRVRAHGGEWVVIAWTDLRANEEAAAPPAWLVDHLLHSARDLFTRHALLDLLAKLGPVGNLPDDWPRLCARVQDEFRRRSLVLVRPAVAEPVRVGGIAPSQKVDTQQTAGTPAKRPKEKTWVAVRLVDQDNVPVPNQKFEIVLPDGSTTQGTTDKSGEGWVEGIDPGNCQVSFPDLDASEWMPG